MGQTDRQHCQLAGMYEQLTTIHKQYSTVNYGTIHQSELAEAAMTTAIWQ